MTLTAEKLRKELGYDSETGVFIRLKDRPRSPAGSPCGTLRKDDGYIDIRVDWVRYKAHRLAWLYVYGEWPPEQLDHINGNRADNRICNLRPCTSAENSQNRVASKKNKTGYPGVFWNPSHGKYQAAISVRGNNKHLGMFDSPAAAHAAYVAAKAEYHTFAPVLRAG